MHFPGVNMRQLGLIKRESTTIISIFTTTTFGTLNGLPTPLVVTSTIITDVLPPSSNVASTTSNIVTSSTASTSSLPSSSSSLATISPPPTTTSSVTPSSIIPPATTSAPSTSSSETRLSSSVVSASSKSSLTTLPSGSAPPVATTTSSNSSHSSGISAGETAGVSIATFIIGVACALLAAWFIMARRRRHSRSTSNSDGRHGEKEPALDPMPIQEESLLDVVDDSTLQGSMSRLNSFIDQHVLGHYHESPTQVPVGQLAQAITESKGVNTMGDISANELARLLLTPSTRFSAIRHFIASVILSNTSLDAQPAACLLPGYIVSFYNAFPPVERQAGCEATFESAFTKWKHASAFLLVENRSLREAPKLDESQIRGAIETNLKTIHRVLAPFMINGSKNLEWEKNLRAIIFSGAELGFILFSQQSTWVFDWNQHDRAYSAGLVVFPALLEKVLGKTRLRIVTQAVMA